QNELVLGHDCSLDVRIGDAEPRPVCQGSRRVVRLVGPHAVEADGKARRGALELDAPDSVALRISQSRGTYFHGSSLPGALRLAARGPHPISSRDACATCQLLGRNTRKM